MRVMVWYKCDFTFWLGDRSLRAHKQNSPRRQTRSFTTLLAFTACLMAKHNGQRWTPREMEILDHCPVALSHFQKLFRLHPVPGGGRRDVEDLEGSGKSYVSGLRDGAAPKVASVYFSPSLVSINIAGAVSAVRSSPPLADR